MALGGQHDVSAYQIGRVLMPNARENKTQSEQMQRALYREFLLEPELFLDVGLLDLPDQLAEALSCAPADAVDQVTNQLDLGDLTLQQLRGLFLPIDPGVRETTTRTATAQLSDPAVSYDQCIRRALCFASGEMYEQAFAALRAAGALRDDWARHHFIYGLIHGIREENERALWELETALQREPYEEGRQRIQAAIDLVKDKETPEA